MLIENLEIIVLVRLVKYTHVNFTRFFHTTNGNYDQNIKFKPQISNLIETIAVTESINKEPPNPQNLETMISQNKEKGTSQGTTN